MTRAPLLRALGDPAVALLWGGLAASAIGDQLFTVVLSWVAVGAFGTAAGYLTVLQGATALVVLLFLGHHTDRLNPLVVMALSDVARAAVLALTVVAWLVAGEARAWSLLACVVVLAAGQSFFRPAMQAGLPRLVADVGLLPAANALLDTTERIARLLGPGLVGLVSVLVPMVHFVSLDVVTFLASAVAIVAITRRRPMEAMPAGGRESAVMAMGRGVRAVWAHPILRVVLLVTGPLNGAWYAVFFIGLPLVISAAEPGPEGLAHYALMISSYGVANLLGTLFMGSRPLPTNPARWIFGGNMLLGIGMAMVGLAALLVSRAWLMPALAAASALSAVGGPMQDILVATMRQTELARADIPAAVRVFMAVNSAGLLVTLAVAPSLFNWLGVPVAIVLAGVGILGMGAAAMRACQGRADAAA
jgi:hypothetical protein